MSRFLPHLTLQYKPGTANTHTPVSVCKMTSGSETGDPMLAKVQEGQRQDAELKMLIEYLKSKVLPSDSKAASEVMNLA